MFHFTVKNYDKSFNTSDLFFSLTLLIAACSLSFFLVNDNYSVDSLVLSVVMKLYINKPDLKLHSNYNFPENLCIPKNLHCCKLYATF